MKDAAIALALFAGLFVVYNANGREIGSYDSQPTKYAARELLRRGTLTLNHVVGQTPQLAERPAFVAARDGRFRSAYSPAPAIAAAAIAWPLVRVGWIDLQSPLSANFIAVIAASVLTAAAVVFAFLTARRWMPPARAAILAGALGLGTGYWTTVSQTLWQHETAAFGLAMAVWALTAREVRTVHLIAAGIGLGIAGATRAQLAVAIAVLLVGATMRHGRRAALPIAITAAFAAAIVLSNYRWFGHPLGAAPLLEQLHPNVHATERSFTFSAAGFAGLLASPSRGLFIYSPIVLLFVVGVPAAIKHGWREPLLWCLLAAVAQYVFYASYSVWWGGHTYGPRYMLDVLPLLVPIAAVGIGAIRFGRTLNLLAGVLLAWSVSVAATGAFVFPHERWNTDPTDVDRHHARLWEWSDMQIVRAWRRGLSPQNFSLFE